MLRTIHLYGGLETLAGFKTLDLDVDTPVMLVNGLRSQISGFRQWCDENKLGMVLSNKDREPQTLNSDDFVMPLGDATDIHLIPETEGSGVEWAAVASWLASYGITSTVIVAIVYVAVNVAIAYAIGAIAQSLAPSPDTSGGGAKTEERPSFLYNGAINVKEQGYAVPLVYGTHMTGSIVVSAGVSVEDIPYVPDGPDATSPPAENWQWESTGGDGSDGTGGY